jgi:lysophospholipase L1-like esterase
VNRPARRCETRLLESRTLPEPRRYARYVALGDSSTEGIDDPDGAGGFRGWANRLAETIAARQATEELLYANLAVRGRRTRRIREEQLGPALAMRPDLATLFTGTNDVVARDFDADAVADDVDLMQRALVGVGATVLTFTLPDLSALIPKSRRLGERIHAMNRRLREVEAANGVLLVDFEAHAMATDLRLWSGDRLHANSEGHARIAAALAQALGLPGSDDAWQRPLPPLPEPAPLARLARELVWIGRHLLPWLWRHPRGRSSGDGRRPKRPELSPVDARSPAPRPAGPCCAQEDG